MWRGLSATKLAGVDGRANGEEINILVHSAQLSLHPGLTCRLISKFQKWEAHHVHAGRLHFFCLQSLPRERRHTGLAGVETHSNFQKEKITKRQGKLPKQRCSLWQQLFLNSLECLTYWNSSSSSIELNKSARWEAVPYTSSCCRCPHGQWCACLALSRAAPGPAGPVIAVINNLAPHPSFLTPSWYVQHLITALCHDLWSIHRATCSPDSAHPAKVTWQGDKYDFWLDRVEEQETDPEKFPLGPIYTERQFLHLGLICFSIHWPWYLEINTNLIRFNISQIISLRNYDFMYWWVRRKILMLYFLSKGS